MTKTVKLSVCLCVLVLVGSKGSWVDNRGQRPGQIATDEAMTVQAITVWAIGQVPRLVGRLVGRLIDQLVGSVHLS